MGSLKLCSVFFSCSYLLECKTRHWLLRTLFNSVKFPRLIKVISSVLTRVRCSGAGWWAAQRHMCLTRELEFYFVWQYFPLHLAIFSNIDSPLSSPQSLTTWSYHYQEYLSNQVNWECTFCILSGSYFFIHDTWTSWGQVNQLTMYTLVSCKFWIRNLFLLGEAVWVLWNKWRKWWAKESNRQLDSKQILTFQFYKDMCYYLSSFF